MSIRRASQGYGIIQGGSRTSKKIMGFNQEYILSK